MTPQIDDFTSLITSGSMEYNSFNVADHKMQACKYSFGSSNQSSSFHTIVSSDVAPSSKLGRLGIFTLPASPILCNELQRWIEILVKMGTDQDTRYVWEQFWHISFSYITRSKSLYNCVEVCVWLVQKYHRYNRKNSMWVTIKSILCNISQSFKINRWEIVCCYMTPKSM